MASAFIYVVIVAMWVAYFVPRWRARNDEVSGKNADRFRNAIKMVSEDFSTNPPVPTREERAIHLRRRRLAFLSVLLTFAAATFLVTVFSLSMLIELIPLSALMIYVVSVRRQVISAQLRNRRLRVLAQITRAPVVLEPLENVMERKISHVDYVKELHSELHFDFGVDVEEIIETEKWIPLKERPVTNGIVLLPHGTAELTEKTPREKTSDTWSPIEVPTPTYVTAPKAVTPRRVIDLTTPGEWSENQGDASALDSFIAEQSLLPEREDGFAIDLENQRADRSHRASGE
jgi:hypothetical protein